MISIFCIIAGFTCCCTSIAAELIKHTKYKHLLRLRPDITPPFAEIHDSLSRNILCYPNTGSTSTQPCLARPSLRDIHVHVHVHVHVIRRSYTLIYILPHHIHWQEELHHILRRHYHLSCLGTFLSRRHSCRGRCSCWSDSETSANEMKEQQ